MMLDVLCNVVVVAGFYILALAGVFGVIGLLVKMDVWTGGHFLALLVATVAGIVFGAVTRGVLQGDW